MLLKNKFLLIYFLLSITIICKAELLVGSINFKGNNFLTDKQLLRKIQTRSEEIFDQKKLNEDAKRISALYAKKGFFNVQVFDPQIFTENPQKIDVLFIIEENEQVIIDSLILTGNQYISTRNIFDRIKSKNLTLNELSYELKNIIRFYSDNGFLFAVANLDSLVNKNTFCEAYITINEGKQVNFKEYKFKGNKVTKDLTLLKISQIEKTNVFTPSILEQSEENIRRKKYIKSCNIIPLNNNQLLFDIEEDKMSLFSGILGYDDSQEKNNKLTGYISLEFLNLFGTDRALFFLWQKLSINRNFIELKYHESGFYSFPVSGDFLINREEVDSTYIKSSFESEVYFYTLHNKYGIYFALDDIFPGSRKPKIVDKTSYTKVGIFWRFNDIDYYYNPTRGNIFDVKYYNTFQSVDNNKTSKQASEVSWQTFKKLFGKTILAFNANIEIIENKDITGFELFDLGGINNLRGFSEKQFYGYLIGWSNFEVRYLLSHNSRVFCFVDYGYAQNQEYTYGKLFGFGFGLRIYTKLGLLGIDYGLGYSNGELRNPLDGIIHFGLETKI